MEGTLLNITLFLKRERENREDYSSVNRNTAPFKNFFDAVTKWMAPLWNTQQFIG